MTHFRFHKHKMYRHGPHSVSRFCLKSIARRGTKITDQFGFIIFQEYLPSSFGGFKTLYAHQTNPHSITKREGWTSFCVLTF